MRVRLTPRRQSTDCSQQLHYCSLTGQNPPRARCPSRAMSENPKARRTGGGRAYRGVLEPHFEFIRQLRRARLTWKEIAARLQSDHGITISLHGVYRFCRRRLERGPSWEDANQEPAEKPSLKPPILSKPFLPANSFRRPDPKQFNPEEYT